MACGQPQAALVRRLSALRGLDTAGRPACGKRPSRLRDTSFPPAGNPFPASETRVSRKWENLKIKVSRVGCPLDAHTSLAFGHPSRSAEGRFTLKEL